MIKESGKEELLSFANEILKTVDELVHSKVIDAEGQEKGRMAEERTK